MTVALMAAGEEGSRRVEVVIGAALALWALLNVGGIFEHRRSATPSDILRLRATAAALAARLTEAPWRLGAMAGLATAVAASWVCLAAYRREFDGAAEPPDRRPDPLGRSRRSAC